jgi:hypothetical protein
MKHVCVAARIGDGEALGAANIVNIRKTSNDASADSGRNPCAILDSKLNLYLLQEQEMVFVVWGWPRVLAHGIVVSHLLRMTKPRVLLRALSQNRASASRVSSC